MQDVRERLQKVMAHSGVASRRASEKLILAGKVSVNGQVVTDLGTSVDTEDIIEVCGRQISRHPLAYYLLHKPVGYLSSASDDRGRRVVTQLVPRIPRVYPVGRLDWDTSGLLLLTNDGSLSYALTHPSFEVRKTYVAKVNGLFSKEMAQRLAKGVALEDGEAKADSIEVLRSGRTSLVRLSIHEGRNRIVRRMFLSIGTPVLGLKREQVGPLSLGQLAVGKYRTLSHGEVQELYGCMGISPDH